MSGVCLVFKRMDIGGAELRTIELAQQFPHEEFTFATTSALHGKLDSSLQGQGHTVLPIGSTLRGYAGFFRYLRANRTRVVHANLGVASGFVLWIAAIAGVPVRVAHFRSDAVGGKHSLKKWLGLGVSTWLINLMATDIVGVSPGSLSTGWKSDWRRDRRCKVLPNMIDRERLAEPSSGTPKELLERPVSDVLRLCSIGRAEASKRRVLAMSIWGELLDGVRADLFLIGGLTESDSAAYIERSVVPPESGRIFSFPYVENAASVLSSMDVLLLTSSREGLPGVVLEAIASGTPVVASDLPGVRWIAEQVTGIRIVNVDASPREWADAVLETCNWDRGEILRSFDLSPFTPPTVVEAFKELWS